MASPTALPLIQYHASLLAPAWGPHSDALELEGEFFRVRNVDIREELGQPWRMTLEVMTNHPQFDPSRLAGAEVSLHMLREDAANPAENDGRFFHGVVTTTEYVGAFADAYHARILVGPALALLGNTKRSRIFQDLNVVEIVQEVTGALIEQRGGELDVSRLVREYSQRDYCVQYDESDLCFVQRVLAEEGITFAFEADESRECTVLFDDRERFGSVLRTVEGLEGNPPPQHVPVRGDRGELADEETIASFTWQHRVHPGHGELEQWDWKQAAPGQLQAQIEPEEVSPRHVGSFYDHAGRRLQEDEGGDGNHRDDSADRLGRKYARIALDASIFDGSSNVMSMVPGATFELDGHPDTEFNGPYYCIRVTHSADNAELELGATDGTNYDNRFVCASLEQDYAPPTLERPRIFGVQTATVVGPEGEEIHTDAYGRIKVRMHWDREQRGQADDTSCWLRVAHSWAGPGFGTQFIPRVGMEVLVSFLGGDADRPVCVGAVYNGSHMPPYGLPDNKTQSGIKTQSSPGGEGFNELRFEDAAGKEEIYMHAQRNHTERVLAAHSQRVGSTQSVSVGSTQTTSVGGKRVVNVTGDQAITVGAPPPEDGEAAAGPSNHSLTVEGDITVTSNQQQITVTAPVSIKFVCGGTSIELTPAGIAFVSGEGAKLDLDQGIRARSLDEAASLTMAPSGELVMENSLNSKLRMDATFAMDAGATAKFLLSDLVRMASTNDSAVVELTTDVSLNGANVFAQATSANLSLGTKFQADGMEVALAAGQSSLELKAADAKLSSPNLDVAGKSLVNVAGPNVKIN